MKLVKVIAKTRYILCPFRKSNQRLRSQSELIEVCIVKLSFLFYKYIPFNSTPYSEKKPSIMKVGNDEQK